MSEIVTYELLDDIASIYMDDGKANAINGEMLAGLVLALDRAESERARAVVLAGRLGFFSGGLDVKRLPILPREELKGVLLGFASLCMKLLEWRRPIVSVSAGHSLAAGQVIMLCTDWKIGSEGPFKYGLHEVSIGIPMPSFICELGRGTLDPRHYFPVIAHGVVMTPEQALRAGMLDELRPPSELISAAREAASRLAALPDEAYRVTKAHLRRPILEAGRSSTTEQELMAHFDAMRG